MNRRIISAILLLIFTFASIPFGAFASGEDTVLYVSPLGNDSHDGSIDSPLATLAGARVRVAALKNSGIYVKEVIFRGGDYYMRETDFTRADSGREGKPIVYRAYDGETPRFKGSVALKVSDFAPVTDKKVLSKVKENVRDRIIETDLTKAGLSRSDLFEPNITSATSYALNGSNSGDYNSVFIDGSECQIAQWPNGRDYASWTSNVNNYTVTYAEPEPDSWAKEKNWWILAFNSSDYGMTRVTPTKVDPDAKTIAVPSNIRLNNRFSKRWKAYNLLRELDMPGEYYIDHDTMKLYMYVPHSIADSVVELSVENYALLDIAGTSDVVFRGLSFEQTRGNAVRTTDINNVDFENCTFRNIGDKAIRQTASKKVTTGSSHWQAAYGYADGAYNCDIRGCYFENLGSSAIYATGGNQDTLTSSGNIIEDNIICAANQRYVIDSALVFTGCGITLRRNVITKSSQHGLQIYGNNHVIEDNEFSDVLREVADAGVIYQGQNQLSRGNTIRRNLIHNVNPKDTRLISGTCGIYVDDRQQGNTIVNNFVIGIKGNGYNSNQASAMNFANNIIVDCRKGWAFHQDGSAEKDVFDKSEWGTIQDMIDDIADPELYFKAYPDLKKWYDTKNNPRTYTKIKENLLVNCEQTAIGTEEARYATIKDNVILDSTDAFVDPQNVDYRLKSDSELAKKLPGSLTDANYDIESNGTVTDRIFTGETNPFRLLYPQNGATVSPTYLQLYWQDVGPANQYRLEIATDPKFQNRVYDGIVYFNIFDADMLSPNTRYFWRVTAQNTTRDLKCEWGHSGNVYSFVTSRYTPIKTENIEYAISSAEDRMTSAVEGANPGAYKPGSIDTIGRYINLTKKLLKLRTGMLGQNVIDARTSYIGNYFKNKALINKGYVNLFDFADPMYWNGNITKVSDEMISLETVSTVAGTKGLSHMSGSVVFCFDAEVTANGYNGIGLNMDSTTTLHTGSNRGYFLCIKKDLIELQKTDGSTNSIVEVSNVAIGDGSRHSIRFGLINTSVGNLVTAVIDGETVFDYIDVTDTAPSDLSLEFGLSTSSREGNCTKLYPSDEIPSQEEFDALVKRAEIKAAKAVMEAFPKDFSDISCIKSGVGVILTDKGITDVSYATPELIGDSMMVPAEALWDTMGISAKTDGKSLTLTKDGKTAVFAEGESSCKVSGETMTVREVPFSKNGHIMVSMLDIKEIFDYELTDDWINNMAIVSKTGSLNIVNDSAIISKVVKVMDFVAKYTYTF